VVRSLASGVPLVACPAAGDMGENASRVAWAGVGVPLPRRLVTARGVRLAVARVLAEPSFAERAQSLREWARRHGGGAVAAETLEAFASNPQAGV
ncbi:MAG: glycosyl transferase, partial [Thermoleophilaceae bacterium]